jgi:hypothetical protein
MDYRIVQSPLRQLLKDMSAKAPDDYHEGMDIIAKSIATTPSFRDLGTFISTTAHMRSSKEYLVAYAYAVNLLAEHLKKNTYGLDEKAQDSAYAFLNHHNNQLQAFMPSSVAKRVFNEIGAKDITAIAKAAPSAKDLLKLTSLKSIQKHIEKTAKSVHSADGLAKYAYAQIILENYLAANKGGDSVKDVQKSQEFLKTHQDLLQARYANVQKRIEAYDTAREIFNKINDKDFSSICKAMSAMHDLQQSPDLKAIIDCIDTLQKSSPSNENLASCALAIMTLSDYLQENDHLLTKDEKDLASTVLLDSAEKLSVQFEQISVKTQQTTKDFRGALAAMTKDVRHDYETSCSLGLG